MSKYTFKKLNHVQCGGKTFEYTCGISPSGRNKGRLIVCQVRQLGHTYAMSKGSDMSNTFCVELETFLNDGKEAVYDDYGD